MPRCCEKCRPLNSARMFENPAPILRKPQVQAILKQKRGCRLIEIGAGCLRNSIFLLEAGFKVSVLEVPGMETRFPKNFATFRSLGGTFAVRLPERNRFELGVATFVLETVCDQSLRSSIVRDLCRSLTRTGCLIISARGPTDLVTAREEGKRCSDGYLTPGYSFARSYTRRQLRYLLAINGFRKVDFLHRHGIESPELLHALAWTNVRK